ncbi:sigma-54 interaction domain-containing protein [Candidatus Nitrospira neomarina]|uniref:Sigma 54-interacting transcriptional regulator n=1 Tax=Candidatus Nitrospira neomarina TaxID=3020899 RepID=A0AA96GKD4_9BACT|nr:sigma 54-interacting transcriptional regulator [Candidatus Nitrospira neomarina]WNM60618.1 sigma 54-interacting transcriptional regulator [Candidatus Nitrospira neomarina]
MEDKGFLSSTDSQVSKDSDQELKRTLHDLQERVKELTALHSTTQLFHNEDLSNQELLQRIADLIPPSWQYPEVTAARIRFGPLEITTPNFVGSPWTQREEFICRDGTTGEIEVVYLEERPTEVEGPFLQEERNLLHSLGEMIRLQLDRKRTQADLREAHDVLEQRVLDRTSDLTTANQLLSREVAQRKEAEEKLEDLIAEIQRNHDDLIAILNQLHIGTALTDRDGKVTFLSQAAQQLCGKGNFPQSGGSWQGLFSDPAYHAQIEDMVNRSPGERQEVLVRMSTVGGECTRWVNVDVRDDPRDPERKMFFLYDASEVQTLRQLLGETGKYQDLIGTSHSMQLVFQQIQDFSRVDSTILIEGETGTGKELVARAIHQASHRNEFPFIAVNCAGLTESLVASQLFGHKRGAFTGAVSDQQGLIEAAEGGTLFLDEIGDIPLTVQTSLLRVLQEWEITRLGESRLRKVNVRVLAATHHNLANDVSAGTFRADLLYRIRVGRVLLPPLRERREDIPLLISHFLNQYRATTGRPVEAVSDEALRLLMAYGWPGNVRELKHAIEFAVIRCPQTIIRPQDLPPEVLNQDERLLVAQSEDIPSSQDDDKEKILAALKQTGGNRSAAAKLLGIARLTLYRRMSRLGIPARRKTSSI